MKISYQNKVMELSKVLQIIKPTEEISIGIYDIKLMKYIEKELIIRKLCPSFYGNKCNVKIFTKNTL